MTKLYLYLTLLVIIALAISCNGKKTESAEVYDKQFSITAEEEQLYLAKGKEVAQTSFQALSGQLQQAMAEGGIGNAIEYCNVHALPLTDSLTQAMHVVSIKRTTEKYRNPENAPTSKEAEQFSEYKKLKLQEKPLKPQLKQYVEGEVVFYAPIELKGQCLSCHGSIEAMGEDYDIIKAKYPSDKATGYKVGDLRGMWSITMKKS